MPTPNLQPSESIRATIGHAFERLVPRKADGAWLDLVTGPALWDWDLETVQRGFNDPLYRFYDANPQRLRSVLAARLLEAAGADPSAWEVALASLELAHLASLIMNSYRNGHTVAEATPDDAPMPLPIMATVAYTARQLSTYLPSRYPPALLADEVRLWLAYRFSRALYEQSVGIALEAYSIASGGPASDEIFHGHLKLSVAPLSFRLPAECAVAAMGAIDTAPAQALQEAASAAGIAYRLGVDLIELGNRVEGRAPLSAPGEQRGITLWTSVFGSDPRASLDHIEPGQWHAALESGLVGRALKLAEREYERAARAAEGAPPALASVLMDFVERVVDPVLRDARAQAR